MPDQRLVIYDEHDRIFTNVGYYWSDDSGGLAILDCTNVTLQGGTFDATRGQQIGVDAAFINNCHNCKFIDCVFIGSGGNDRQACLLYLSNYNVFERCKFLFPEPATPNTGNWGKCGLTVAGDYNVIRDCDVHFSDVQYGPGGVGSTNGRSLGLRAYGGDVAGSPNVPRGNIFVNNRITNVTGYGIGFSGGGSQIAGAYTAGNRAEGNVINCHPDAYAGIYATNYQDGGLHENCVINNRIFNAEYAVRNKGGRLYVDGVYWYPGRASFGSATYNDTTDPDFVGELIEEHVYTNFNEVA